MTNKESGTAMTVATQPVAVGAAFVALANSVLAFVVLVGLWHATPEALAGAELVAVNATVFATAVWTRRRVTPTVNVPVAPTPPHTDA